LGDRDPDQSNGLRLENPGQDYDGEGVKPLLNRVCPARQGVGACVLSDEALDDGGDLLGNRA
jgi:hypothetical protein